MIVIYIILNKICLTIMGKKEILNKKKIHMNNLKLKIKKIIFIKKKFILTNNFH